MKVKLSNEEVDELLALLDEYKKTAKATMFEYKHLEVDAEDMAIKQQYAMIAQEEEEKYNCANRYFQLFTEAKEAKAVKDSKKKS